jgi:uncharacterized protein YndB with AHSA1/START domain
MSDRKVSRTVLVAASPEEIFDLLADPRRHPELDGSGTLTGKPTGPERLSKGAKFGMSMQKHGVPYRITNTVVEFDEGRRIAWRHFHRHVWSWELRPVDAGTEVTETFDWGPSLAPWAIEWAKFPAQNAHGIEETLARLQKRFA